MRSAGGGYFGGEGPNTLKTCGNELLDVAEDD
jgi:hypothetical protein